MNIGSNHRITWSFRKPFQRVFKKYHVGHFQSLVGSMFSCSMWTIQNSYFKINSIYISYIHTIVVSSFTLQAFRTWKSTTVEESTNCSGITIDVEKTYMSTSKNLPDVLPQIRGNQGKVCFKHPMFQTFRKRGEANFCFPKKYLTIAPSPPGCLCWRIALSCHLPVGSFKPSSRQLQGSESIRLVAIGPCGLVGRVVHIYFLKFGMIPMTLTQNFKNGPMVGTT